MRGGGVAVDGSARSVDELLTRTMFSDVQHLYWLADISFPHVFHVGGHGIVVGRLVEDDFVVVEVAYIHAEKARIDDLVHAIEADF